MALSITVNGAGTFTASMEEGPVSFTASLGAVPGPKGDTGATGPAGVVAATAPITYNSGTQTVAMDTAYFVRSPAVAGTDGYHLVWDGGTSRPVWQANETGTVYTTGTNKTGSTLAKGTVVYINGAQGSKFTIAKALASGDATSAQTLGVVQTDIANNAAGNIITFGEISGLDTSAYADGTQLYLSPTTAGAFTSTKPSAPDHLVYVAIVSYSHGVNGKVLVKVQNGYELEELHNVAIASVANNDILAYDSATSLWKNKTRTALDLLTATTAASTYQTQAGMSNYAPLASPTFTGDPKAPTPATSDNDTSIATTAFVNAYCPSASTSTAGKVQLATNAETLTGTVSTKAVTPASAYWADKRSGHSFIQFNTMTAATSGTGAQASATVGGYGVAAPTTAVGYGVGNFSYPAAQRGINRGNGSWDWSKAFTATFRFSRNALPTDTNSISRVTFGKASGTGVGDLTLQGVGIKMAGSNALQLTVHNGTTYTEVTTTSSIVPTSPLTYDIRITSDGAGNVSLYVNEALEATTSAGPTSKSGTTGASFFVQEAHNAAIITGSPAGFSVYNLHFEFAN